MHSNVMHAAVFRLSISCQRTRDLKMHFDSHARKRKHTTAQYERKAVNTRSNHHLNDGKDVRTKKLTLSSLCAYSAAAAASARCVLRTEQFVRTGYCVCVASRVSSVSVQLSAPGLWKHITLKRILCWRQNHEFTAKTECVRRPFHGILIPKRMST